MKNLLLELNKLFTDCTALAILNTDMFITKIQYHQNLQTLDWGLGLFFEKAKAGWTLYKVSMTRLCNVVLYRL